jgi:hypothetical protein
MNCIAIKRILPFLTLAACAGCSAPATEAISAGDTMAYSVRYQLTPIPDRNAIDVSMHVRQGRYLLREVRFERGPLVGNIRVDGESIDAVDEISWRPAESGGTLQWTVELAHERNGAGYDAWLGSDWGVFRAEDIIPRAATRAVRGAYSKTSMQFDLPTRWSVVTAYPEENEVFKIEKPQRSFDQPDGWIAIGRLGVRRETIAGMRVAVAGPVGHSIRRMETIALLNWTMPELSRVLTELPPRLTIISAGSPMWRGGLSAPYSLYLHAERRLISENATSPLLHEVMHSILRISAIDGYDWLVEGIAEYYSLELLRRSGTISEERFQKAMAFQAEWSASASELCRSASTGASTALAVTIMAALDAEVREQSNGNASMDDVLRELQKADKPIALADLKDAVEDLGGAKSATLQLDKLPGCRSIDANDQEAT